MLQNKIFEQENQEMSGFANTQTVFININLS